MSSTFGRGRGTSRQRSTYGAYSGFSFGPGSNPWGGSDGGNSRRTGGRKASKGAGTGNTSAYKNCSAAFEKKIDSFKTLYAQTCGPAGQGRPTPTTLNSFANWINKGAIIQTCSPAQISRWARATRKNFNSRNPSPTACKSVLCAKFGRSAIKAVARTKTGTFMVATTPTLNGRSFCFPH